jgi:hypothetical protein
MIRKEKKRRLFFIKQKWLTGVNFEIPSPQKRYTP